MTHKHGSPIGIGIIGCGHWGPNHIRVFSERQRSQVVAVADSNPTRLATLQARFPGITTTLDYRRVLDHPSVDAVVIATPTVSHFAIAEAALQKGKHILVEKPMCRSSAEARKLQALAQPCDRVVMVGHVFLFNNGIRKLREAIADGQIGRLHYLDAVRTNLGPIRGDVNALYDLGTHDITIMNYLMNAAPVAVSAIGRCISQSKIEDVCFATLRYADGTLGHIHVSWMNPHKVRTLTVIGDRQMAHWDDIDPENTLRLYDRGVAEPPAYNSFGEFQYLLRNADVYLPAIRRTEPLINQAEAFLDWIVEGKPSPCGVNEGLQTALILEAADRSIRSRGAEVPIVDSETGMVIEATALRRTVAFNDEALVRRTTADVEQLVTRSIQD